MVVRSCYLHNGISYTGKMSSLYWIGAQTVKLASSRSTTDEKVGPVKNMGGPIKFIYVIMFEILNVVKNAFLEW